MDKKDNVKIQVKGDYINTVKTTFLFKLRLLTSFYRITSLQVIIENLYYLFMCNHEVLKIQGPMKTRCRALLVSLSFFIRVHTGTRHGLEFKREYTRPF